MAGLHVGSTIKHINTSELADFVVPLPSLSEQKRISEILTTSDEGIEQVGRLIAAKKTQKGALMQQLLAGKKRLPGFSGDWKMHRLGELFKERNEIKAEHLPLLAITASRGLIHSSEINRKDSSSEDKSRYKVIRPGDIGYNTMRMWQGVSAVSHLDGIISPAYTVCTPGRDIDVNFVGYFFKFHPTVHLFWRYSQGLVDDTLNLKYLHFASISVKVPPLGEQRAIADVLLCADAEIALLQRKLAALQQQKKGLMQKLLTGQIRVKP
jgi:type I restriction enzyme S subunit